MRETLLAHQISPKLSATCGKEFRINFLYIKIRQLLFSGPLPKQFRNDSRAVTELVDGHASLLYEREPVIG